MAPRGLTLRTQSGMVWVLGERWWVLMTMTVMMMEAMTKTMVKSMYFPMSGTALEVDGMSSTMTSRNTVRDSRTEMLRVIFSPATARASIGLLLTQWFSNDLLVTSVGRYMFQLRTPFRAIKHLREGKDQLGFSHHYLG